MDIKLKKLTLDYFKGQKRLEISFTQETNIFGDNGTGKSTIFDAFSWLLFGKNREGKTDFTIKTNDADGKPIPHIDHTVTGELLVDGRSVTLSRTFREKWVKKRGAAEATFEGNETIYHIDNVPVQSKEYEAYINSLIAEDMFKLITNPHHFNALPWTKRREILTSMIGVTDKDVAATRAEFRALLDSLGETPLEMHRKRLNERKKLLKRDLEAIPTRIDEAMRQMPEPKDYQAIEQKIASTQEELAGIEVMIADKSKANEAVFAEKRARQQQIYDRKEELSRIEFQAKQEAEKRLSEANAERIKKQAERHSLSVRLSQAELDSEAYEREIQTIEVKMAEKRAEWTHENERKPDFGALRAVCPTCERPFTEEELAGKKAQITENFNQSKSEILNRISSEGVNLSNRRKSLVSEKELKDTNVIGIKEAIRCIDVWLADNPEVTDINIVYPSDYEEKKAQITYLEELPDENTVDFSALTDQKKLLADTLDNLKYQLSTRKLETDIRERIKQLNEQQKSIAQQVADIENDEFIVEQFIRTKIDMLDGPINAMFSTIRFRLFDTLNDGTPVECCDAMIGGAPYNDANDAGKLNAGLEIINVLGKHYSVCAPVFIDNRESTTRIIPMSAQIINLYVSEAHKTLTVQ